MKEEIGKCNEAELKRVPNSHRAAGLTSRRFGLFGGLADRAAKIACHQLKVDISDVARAADDDGHHFGLQGRDDFLVVLIAKDGVQFCTQSDEEHAWEIVDTDGGCLKGWPLWRGLGRFVFGRCGTFSLGHVEFPDKS